MDRRLDLSGGSFSRLLYASQLVALALALVVLVLSLDGSAGVPLALLFASLVVATVVGVWRSTTDGDDGSAPGTAEDITYDPVADPGQAAKHRWEKAVRRLPAGDDDGD